jgi:hypothetical protein
MEEGQLKKLLIAWAGQRITGYEDKEVFGINIRAPVTQKILELECVFKIVDEAKKEFPLFTTENSIIHKIQDSPELYEDFYVSKVFDWFVKWFGGEKESV